MAFGVGAGNRGWVTAGAICLALLALPALAFLLLPRAGGFATPPPARPSFTLPFGSNEDPEPEAADSAEPRAVEDAKVDIEGTVVDPDGAPVAKARVACLDHADDRELATTTDAQGRYALPPRAEGCRAVATHAEFARSDEDRIFKGRTNRLRLNAGGTIEGLVIDERGVPITDFSIGVESFAPSDPDASSATRPSRSFSSRNGAFTLEKLVPGRYVLGASAAGRPSAHGDAIQVASGRTVRGVKLVLARGTRFTGRVLDGETKKPVAGASVALDAVSEVHESEPVTTDAAGVFVLEAAPPGPFSIHVAHGSYRSKIVPGLTTGLGATPRVDVELTPRGDGGQQTELSGIGVRIMPMAGGKVRVFGLDADGPGGKAGLEAQDVIARIDGVDVTTLTLSECVQRLRGPAGSTVVVTVERGAAPVDLTVTRAEIVTGGY